MKVISTKDGAPMMTALSGLASEMGGRRRKEGSQASNGTVTAMRRMERAGDGGSSRSHSIQLHSKKITTFCKYRWSQVIRITKL